MERKRFGTELVLVYCVPLLDDGLQSTSVSVELKVAGEDRSATNRK